MKRRATWPTAASANVSDAKRGAGQPGAGASANRRKPGDRIEEATRNLDQLGQQAEILEQRPECFAHKVRTAVNQETFLAPSSAT